MEFNMEKAKELTLLAISNPTKESIANIIDYTMLIDENDLEESEKSAVIMSILLKHQDARDVVITLNNWLTWSNKFKDYVHNKLEHEIYAKFQNNLQNTISDWGIKI